MVKPTVTQMVAWGFAAVAVAIGLADAWAFSSRFGLGVDLSLIWGGLGVGIGQAFPAVGQALVNAVKRPSVS